MHLCKRSPTVALVISMLQTYRNIFKDKLISTLISNEKGVRVFHTVHHVNFVKYILQKKKNLSPR